MQPGCFATWLQLFRARTLLSSRVQSFRTMRASCRGEVEGSRFNDCNQAEAWLLKHAARSGPRMRAVVHLAQPPGVDVAVHLRRRERAVAEQLLDRAQIG